MRRRDTILLVEDNPDDVLFMRRASSQADIKLPINVVEDGQAAIDYLEGSGKYADRETFPIPSLVLLDLKLPYKNGLQVLQWIRQCHSLRGLPVIMFTTSAEASDVERSYCLGANGYLVKPANMNELISILKALRVFWLEYNVLPQFSAKPSLRGATGL